MNLTINFNRILFLIFFIFFLQTIFFNLLYYFFPFEADSFLSWDFYLINILSCFIICLSFLFLKIKFKNKIFLKISFPDRLENILFILLTIGCIFFLIAKFILYYDSFYEVVKSGMYYNNEKNKILYNQCFSLLIRTWFVTERSELISSPIILNFYYFFNLIGTVFINFLYVNLFFYFFFYERLKKKIIFITLIIIAIIVYYFLTSSKNLILNTFSFLLCCLTINFIFEKKLYFKYFFLFFFVLFFLLTLSYNLRSNCFYKYGNYDYVSEFSYKYYANQYEHGEFDKFDFKTKNQKYTLRLNSSNLLLFQYQLLNGYINGEYLVKKAQETFYKREPKILVAKTLNFFIKSFNKNYIPIVSLPAKKSAGGIGFVYLLWLDYSYFGLPIFITCFLLFLISIINLFNSKFLGYNALFSLTTFSLFTFFFIFIQNYNWYALEIMNSKFVIFSLFIFFNYIFFYKKFFK
jgi:hypothetical protein